MHEKPVALVTGAGRGIGRAIAIELAREGFSVVGVSRTASELNETLRLMNETRPTAKSVVQSGDVSKEEFVRQVFDMAEGLGDLSVLVNNAGYVDPKGLIEITLENWNLTIGSNLTSTFLCCKEFLKRRKEKGGKIINIASTAGLTPRPGWAAYAAAKAAVVSLSQTLSEELRPYGIKVYCIAPGRTATVLRRRLAPSEDQSTILQPEAVARLTSLLASEVGEYIDGQPIIIRKQTVG
jgi:3-oxoacyl-[acyl-carrier protein] reductase